MKIKTLDDFDFDGKRVLLRLDLNSEVKSGKVILGNRIIQSSITIRELKKKGAKVVILAHQGRKGDKDFISLSQHAKLLNKFVKVKFTEDILGNKAVNEILNLRSGEVLLLENVRFLNDEFFPSKKNKLVTILSPLFDIYINDAFSVSHRNHTSVVSFPEVLPSGIGRLMQKELENLQKLNSKNALFALGGKKIEEILLLLNGKRKILASGTFSLLALISVGYNFGKQGKELKKDFKNFSELKSKLKNVILPIDFAVDFNGKRKNVALRDFPLKYFAYDIGEETIKLFIGELKKAEKIFMKGPAGKIEDKKFRKGTRELLLATAQSRAFKVLGGGHLTTAIKEFGISERKFDYISLSGGAMLEFLAGKKLPGLEVLKKHKF